MSQVRNSATAIQNTRRNRSVSTAKHSSIDTHRIGHREQPFNHLPRRGAWPLRPNLCGYGDNKLYRNRGTAPNAINRLSRISVEKYNICGQHILAWGSNFNDSPPPSIAARHQFHWRTSGSYRPVYWRHRCHAYCIGINPIHDGMRRQLCFSNIALSLPAENTTETLLCVLCISSDNFCRSGRTPTLSFVFLVDTVTATIALNLLFFFLLFIEWFQTPLKCGSSSECLSPEIFANPNLQITQLYRSHFALLPKGPR